VLCFQQAWSKDHVCKWRNVKNSSLYNRRSEKRFNFKLIVARLFNKSPAFWDVSLYSPAEINQCVRSTYFIQHQGYEAANTSQTQVNFYETTRRNNSWQSSSYSSQWEPGISYQLLCSHAPITNLHPETNESGPRSQDNVVRAILPVPTHLRLESGFFPSGFSDQNFISISELKPYISHVLTISSSLFWSSK
jgi:hypothetical protein